MIHTLLNTRYPILQGGMAHIATPALQPPVPTPALWVSLPPAVWMPKRPGKRSGNAAG